MSVDIGAGSAIVAAKRAIRSAALARRDALSPEARVAGSAALSADAVERVAGPVAGRVVSGFWPIRSEIDPRPLMMSLEGARRTARRCRASWRGNLISDLSHGRSARVGWLWHV